MARTEKLRAARDQHKAEREQLIASAVESGTAVRVPVSVTTHGGSLEDAKERTLAELRRQGEKRQIIFDEMVIETGVPRSREFFSRSGVTADDAPKERIRAPEGEALRAQGFPEYRPPQASPMPETERRRFRTTVQLPNNTAPQGEVAEGWFMVRGGILHVEDMHGRLLGRQALQPGDNAEAIARRILRDKSGGGNDFYRRLQYPPNSIH